jgi:hypothetical protein
MVDPKPPDNSSPVYDSTEGSAYPDGAPPAEHVGGINGDETTNGNGWDNYLAVEVKDHAQTHKALAKSQTQTKKLEAQLAKKDLETLGKLEAMKTRHREEKKRIQNDMNSDKTELLKHIKIFNEDHRIEIADKKIEIRDLKSIKTSQTTSSCNYAQAKKELKDTIQLLEK